MKKVINLELAEELLNDSNRKTSDGEIKISQSEKKKLKELRLKHPVRISISFKWPWWDLSHQEK